MGKFRIRYEEGRGPEGSGDVVEVEAEVFLSQGDFVDFFAKAIPYTGGELRPAGPIVFRVRGDLVVDISQVPGP